MADPLSISASVAGLFSLGVQVVSGTTQYLDAVRERRHDVASARTQIERTQELLRLVENAAGKLTRAHNAAAAFLRSCAAIGLELKALEEFARAMDTENMPSPRREALGKVSIQAKKLTYPFHRQTMDRLRSQLERVNGMLQSAQHIALLDVAIDIERTTSTIETTLPDMALRIDAVGPLVQDTGRQLSERFREDSLASRSAIAGVGDSVELLCGRLDQGIVGIQEKIATASTMSVSALRKDCADSHSRILQEQAATRGDVAQVRDIARRVDVAIRALPTREQLGRLVSTPGHLKELCDTMDGAPEARDTGPRSRISPARTRTCICRRRLTRSERALVWGPWRASAEASTAQDHLPGCVVYHVKGAEASSRRWAVAFTGLQTVANRAIEVSFSCSFGAGGCSLGPSVTCYPSIDRRRDPAFRIMVLMDEACSSSLGDEFWELRSSDLVEFLELCVENMITLYRHGKTSPKAVDSYGRGVMHYLGSFLHLYIEDKTECRLLAGLSKLVEYGVEATTYDIYGLTPAWYMNRSINVWTLQMSDERGADRKDGPPTHPSQWDSFAFLSNFLCSQEPCDSIVIDSRRLGPIKSPVVFTGILKRSPATAEAFGCGPLSLAALEGNPGRMKNVLSDYPNAVNEVNLLSQTPLHLAVGHSRCVALLLGGEGRKLVDVQDIQGRRPMEYALFSCLCGTAADGNQYGDGCLRNRGDTSLKILLDADCMMPKKASWPQAYYDSDPFFLCSNCLHTVSTHLVDRRERLKRLAIDSLPRMRASAFGLFSPSVLDSNATRVVQSLNERGVSVPMSLRVEHGLYWSGCNELNSVYHSDSPLPFPVLWGLGFCDVDTPDADGLTPLMSRSKSDWLGRRSAAACSWLIENGADPWKLTPEGISTVGHELYSWIGRAHWCDDAFSEQDLQDRAFDLTGKLAQRDPRDECHCACSPGGCTPFVRFLQAAIRLLPYSPSALELLENLPLILTRTHKSISTVQMRSAIRLATFEVLGIRHTCHHDGGRPSKEESEEFEELRQEDRFRVDRLEGLIKDFEVELEQMFLERDANKHVSFWHRYWLPRMEQALESIQSGGIEESDRVAAEDAGVVWHMEEFGSDADYDSGSEDSGYHESDWDSELEEEEMFETFRTVDDWISRLDLIMSKAGLST